MDHADARELLELAAAEPGGLERLMAGDTPDAAALAGHLAGCRDCADEMTRLRRASAAIGAVIRSTPPPDLRARTLRYVAAVGRDRPTAPDPGAAATTPLSTLPTDAVDGSIRDRTAAVPAGSTRRGHGHGPTVGWLTALAAAVILAVAGTALVVGRQRDAETNRQAAALEDRAREVAALERVTGETVRIAAAPDARRVELTPADGGDAAGTLLFSPGSRDLVVVGTGLTEPAAGQELRCWVEVAGQRRPVGRMYFADRLAFWAGQVDAVADLADGARFGVTLVDADGPALGGPAVLAGEL